jgi:hypothetical protein
MKRNRYGNLFVGISIRAANEGTKWQIYKTEEKEDVSFMAYFVVQALSNCACVS